MPRKPFVPSFMLDTGAHVAPDKGTFGEWARTWIEIGAPGQKRRKANGARAVERYGQLLRHVLPVLGKIKLQQLQSTNIDKLYASLEGTMAPQTLLHIHNVLRSCLGAAVRTRKLAISPMDHIAKVPAPCESDHGIALDDEQLRRLVEGFRGSVLYPIVAVAAFTGMRRGEILALRHSDLDVQRKELRIERAIEETKTHGRRFKGPKTERGKRTITIDDDLIALLLQQKEKHLRMIAGIPTGAAVDLSLIKLPEGALMFPSPGDLLTPQRLKTTTEAFMTKAEQLGFPGLRFHDLRGTHETLLLDRGVPVHVVAARCGHDPAVLLRTYAKRTPKADTSAASVIGGIARGILK